MGYKYHKKWDTVPEYIEKIEQAVRDIVAEYGPDFIVATNRERIGGNADLLMPKILDLSDKLAKELSMRGDCNITFLHALSLISTAWYTFILEAKSRALKRYGKENCKGMGSLAKEYPKVLRDVFKSARRYGRDYPVDNPEWEKAIKKYKLKKYSVDELKDLRYQLFEKADETVFLELLNHVLYDIFYPEDTEFSTSMFINRLEDERNKSNLKGIISNLLYKSPIFLMPEYKEDPWPVNVIAQWRIENNK